MAHSETESLLFGLFILAVIIFATSGITCMATRLTYDTRLEECLTVCGRMSDKLKTFSKEVCECADGKTINYSVAK